MPNRIFQTKAKVIKNIEVIKNYYKIVVLCPAVAKVAQPGQFLQVKVNNSVQPLLRRPFGVHRLRGPNIEILYEVVGQGTEILAQRKSGEYLDIIGPLGNGFDSRRKRDAEHSRTGGTPTHPIALGADSVGR